MWLAEQKFTVREKLWLMSRRFYKNAGYYPNFKMPKSLNEKINWLKFNYHDPIQTTCIDKVLVKEWVESKVGKNYVIPLIGTYFDVNDIDFDKLPSKFMLKTPFNAAGKGCFLVEDKQSLDIDLFKSKINDAMQDWNNLYYYCLSRGYKDIEPKILIENYMPIREGAALEYKMFCFHGKMKFCLIECDYFGKHPQRAIYDADFNNLPFKIGKYKHIQLAEKPKNYDKMVELSELLSKDFPHVRVDLYDINDQIYVGEMSFTSGGGYSTFIPREWDYKIGEWLDLSKLNPEYLHIEPEFAEAAKSFINPDIVNSHIAHKDSSKC